MITIFIGNNSKHLLGCENDAIMFYNLFETLQINQPTQSPQKSPQQTSQQTSQQINNVTAQNKKFLLTGKQATTLNLEKIFRNNKSIENLIIYFSGHGFYGGNLEFGDKIVNALEIYELINDIFINDLNIFFILDCCYSGSYPLIKNFQKIKNVSILASCKNNEKSSESLAIYNPQDFNFIKPNFLSYKSYFNLDKINLINKEDNIIVGAFTYNLIKIIKQNNLTNINNWFLIENEKILKTLEKNINQKITIIK